MQFYRQTESDNEEELNQAIPGAKFHWVGGSGPSFGARYRHLVLDGIVLSHLELHQASILTRGERIRDFNIWHAIGPLSSASGSVIRNDELVMVRPGEGGTLRTSGQAYAQSFALQPTLFAEASELELPFGPRAAARAGRWRLASSSVLRRFRARHQAILEQIDACPALLETPATRAMLRNAIVEAISALGQAGSFQPDRSSVGRHTRIMLRFEQIVQEAGDEPLSMLDICRLAGTSRRSLEAIVLARTGKAPWEYLRWRRLWQARSLLSRPEADMTVTGVAHRLGFWHLGRFAGAYAAAFGEQPSLTLGRATGTRIRSSDAIFARNG
jgi:AraC-like DNA-binding protein